MTSQAGKPTGLLPNPYAAIAQSTNAGATPSANGNAPNAEGPAKEPKKTNLSYVPQQANRGRNRPQAAKNQSRPALPAVPAFSARSSSTGDAPSVGQNSIEYFRSTAEDDAANMEEMQQRKAEERQRNKEQKKLARQFGYWYPDAPYTGKSWTNQKSYIGQGQWLADMAACEAMMRKTGELISQSTPPPPPEAVAAPDSPKLEAEPEKHVAETPSHQKAAAPYQATFEAPPALYAPLNAQKHRANESEGRPSKKQKTAAEPEHSGNAYKMMAKMGWAKGQGLGKNNQGITAPLSVQMGQKRDSESSAPQVWDIVGQSIAAKDEPGKFGEQSQVIVTWGCVDGIDWVADADRNDGGIRQEMGDYFGTKFGNVERVHVNMTGSPQAVYVKFNSALSALNALNKLDQGLQFNNKDVRARFYDEAKFNANIFDH